MECEKEVSPDCAVRISFSKAFQSFLCTIALPKSQLGIEKSRHNHYTITTAFTALRLCCSLRPVACRWEVAGDEVRDG